MFRYLLAGIVTLISVGSLVPQFAQAADVVLLKPTILDYQSEVIRALAFNSDGTLLAVSPKDNDVWVCDPRAAKYLSALKGVREPSTYLFPGQKPDLLYAVEGSVIRLVNLKTGANVATSGASVGVSGNGVVTAQKDFLAVASASGGVELLRADLKETLGKLAAPESSILAGESKSSVAAFAPDGLHAAGGRPTGRVYLWTVEGSQEKGVQNIAAHSGPVDGLEFTSAGLLSLGRDGKLKLWNVADGKELAAWSFDTPLSRGWLLAGGRAAAIIRQPGAGEVQIHRLPAIAGESPALLASINVVDVFDGFALRGADMSVEHLALSPDGTRLALAFQAGSAELTNARVAFYDVASTLGKLVPPATSSTIPSSTNDPIPKPAADFRFWTSADGNFKIEAQLASFRGNIVTLRRKDNGKLIPLKLEQLSPEDQKFVRDGK